MGTSTTWIVRGSPRAMIAGATTTSSPSATGIALKRVSPPAANCCAASGLAKDENQEERRRTVEHLDVTDRPGLGGLQVDRLTACNSVPTWCEVYVRFSTRNATVTVQVCAS